MGRTIGIDMKNILNITNGDCAVEIMKKAAIPGAFLPWRDLLHEGPVPAELSLEELSKVRAQYIIDRNWGKPQEIIDSFIERDNVLKSFRKYEKVILWFEHDLYDQLQIIQILDWFHQNWVHQKCADEVELSIICTEQYLGRLSPEEIKKLIQYEERITEAHLELSSQAWSAFRSSSPEEWWGLLNTDTSALPFLKGAIVRLLEEYPSCSNGLSRTADQALRVVSEGVHGPGKIFSGCQELEERVFLGDSSFWVILQELLESSPALLTLSNGKKLNSPITKDQELTITPVGLEVFSGKRNWLEFTNLDRWVGGVHLGNTNVWCWDLNSRVIVKRG
ncbi:MAG: hypothetical protein KUG82_00615 [Pseudomonadales bacterium]|nr:hypothetical protein [Pseudomonadales bacterium]